MATHLEKDDLIKKLKDQLKELKEKVVDQTEILDTKALSIVKKDGNYYLVMLEFNKESGRGKVIGEVNYGRDVAIVIFKAKEYMSMEIIQKSIKGK